MVPLALVKLPRASQGEIVAPHGIDQIELEWNRSVAVAAIQFFGAERSEDAHWKMDATQNRVTYTSDDAFHELTWGSAATLVVEANGPIVSRLHLRMPHAPYREVIVDLSRNP